ncbi:MAG: aromatic amino acid ammonia-lyase, partial [Planctomycetota bacterium]
MTVLLNGSSLTTESVLRVARHREEVALAPEALERVAHCRSFLDTKIEDGTVMYGINTGIGELCNVVLDPGQIRDFQRYLVYSHAAGYGEPLPEEAVRAAMTSRTNVLVKGHSGCRPLIPQTMVALLNAGVTPVVCSRGSVGACGDLSPMSQIALVLIGEGEAFYEGERLPASEALAKAGLEPIVFEARDGLSSINGSNVIAGMGSIAVEDTESFLAASEAAASLTLQALNANLTGYDERLHSARGFPGSVR